MSSTKAKAALKQAKELISKGDFKYEALCYVKLSFWQSLSILKGILDTHVKLVIDCRAALKNCNVAMNADRDSYIAIVMAGKFITPVEC